MLSPFKNDIRTVELISTSSPSLSQEHQTHGVALLDGTRAARSRLHAFFSPEEKLSRNVHTGSNIDTKQVRFRVGPDSRFRHLTTVQVTVNRDTVTDTTWSNRKELKVKETRRLKPATWESIPKKYLTVHLFWWNPLARKQKTPHRFQWISRDISSRFWFRVRRVWLGDEATIFTTIFDAIPCQWSRMTSIYLGTTISDLDTREDPKNQSLKTWITWLNLTHIHWQVRINAAMALQNALKMRDRLQYHSK